jgi:hypothetical protein
MLAARGTKVNCRGQGQLQGQSERREKLRQPVGVHAIRTSFAWKETWKERRTRMSKATAKIKIENVLQPGKTYSADPAKYEAMKKAVLAVLPKTSPGLTVAEVQGRVLAHLPEDLFPGGAKSGWWMKAVQLDLEAKHIIKREKASPVRLYKS